MNMDIFADVIYDNGEKLFRATDIANILGLKNIFTSMVSFNKDDTRNIDAKTNGGPQNVTYLTINGLKKILIKSRKIKALELAKLCGIDILSYKVANYENTTISQILDAFNGEEMIEQYSVCNYRIDLYFPKYKLAIECDEHHHIRIKNKEKDIQRQKEIETKLLCTFIRYSPGEPDFSIFKTINAIYKFIKAYEIENTLSAQLNICKIIE
jgi:very-short-patch-repair endonuclease